MKKSPLLPLLLAGLLSAPGLRAEDLPPPPAPAPEKGIARGLMLAHGDRLIFSPCRDRSYLAVEDASPGGEVVATLKQLGLADGRPLYVELVGESTQDRLQASALNFAHTDARCHAPRQTAGHWRAAGKTWQLTTTGDKLRLAQGGGTDQETGFTEKQADPSTARLQAGDATWEFRKRPCLQSEDGFASGWTAEGRSASQTWRGCAWRP